MLRFFRTVRRKLLNRGNFRKTLVYALGEVLLVMIGILLALQVNTWNENRKDRILEKNYIERLINDLKADTMLINRQIRIAQERERRAKYIDSIMTGAVMVKDPRQFISSLVGVGRGITPYFNTNTYENLMNSGDLKLISSPSILNSIQEYYKLFESPFWLFTREIYVEKYLPQVAYLIPDSIYFPTWNNEKEIPITMEQTNDIIYKFRNSKDLDFLLNEAIRLSSGQPSMFYRLKSEANELMRKLNNHLDDH